MDLIFISTERSTWAASISSSCFWMSNDKGRNIHKKNKSDFSKNDLCDCLQEKEKL